MKSNKTLLATVVLGLCALQTACGEFTGKTLEGAGLTSVRRTPIAEFEASAHSVKDCPAPAQYKQLPATAESEAILITQAGGGVVVTFPFAKKISAAVTGVKYQTEDGGAILGKCSPQTLQFAVYGPENQTKTLFVIRFIPGGLNMAQLADPKVPAGQIVQFKLVGETPISQPVPPSAPPKLDSPPATAPPPPVFVDPPAQPPAPAKTVPFGPTDAADTGGPKPILSYGP